MMSRANRVPPRGGPSVARLPPWSVAATLTLLVVLLGADIAQAKVLATFYAREYGEQFPHTFVRITGATDAKPGIQLDENYGFTAVHITPALLLGPSAGRVESVSPQYVARATPYLRLTLTDAEYAGLMAVIRRWEALPQPSYDLNRRNCVFFVAEMAQVLGLGLSWHADFVLHPTRFMQHLQKRNPSHVARASEPEASLAEQ